MAANKRSPDFVYSDVVELVECGLAKAGQYLAAGYKLVQIGTVSDWKENPGSPGSFGMHRRIRYALGRTEGVPPYVPPEKVTP